MDWETYTPNKWRIPIGIEPSTGQLKYHTYQSNGPHRYSYETRVGRVSEGVTPEAAFEALRHHAAPGQERRVSQTGDTTNIPIRWLGGWVRHTVFPEHLTIVNTTLPGHGFHEGNVFRRIVQRGDDVLVVTEGYGTGDLRDLNKSIAPIAWKTLDFGIRSWLNRPAGAHDIDNIMNTTIPEIYGAVGEVFNSASIRAPTPPSLPATGPRPFLPRAFLPGALSTASTAD